MPPSLSTTSTRRSMLLSCSMTIRKINEVHTVILTDDTHGEFRIGRERRIISNKGAGAFALTFESLHLIIKTDSFIRTLNRFVGQCHIHDEVSCEIKPDLNL